jgi:hypothetical protein
MDRTRHIDELFDRHTAETGVSETRDDPASDAAADV